MFTRQINIFFIVVFSMLFSSFVLSQEKQLEAESHKNKWAASCFAGTLMPAGDKEIRKHLDAGYVLGGDLRYFLTKSWSLGINISYGWETNSGYSYSHTPISLVSYFEKPISKGFFFYDEFGFGAIFWKFTKDDKVVQLVNKYGDLYDMKGTHFDLFEVVGIGFQLTDTESLMLGIGTHIIFYDRGGKLDWNTLIKPMEIYISWTTHFSSF